MLGIGSYLWSDGTESPPGWYPPAGSVSIDLSSFAQIAAATPGQPRGVALFQFQPTDDTKEFLNAGGVLLSSDDARDGTPDGKGLDAIESLLGYRPRGDRWSDCLWDILTAGADPANLDGPGILVPTVGCKLELWFANSLYRSDDFDFATDPLTPKLKALLQSQLNAARNLALDGQMISPVTKQPDLEYHLRIADAMIEKYAGKNPQTKADLFVELKPDEWDAAEQPKPHATTITESFPTDSATISSGQDLSWTEINSGNHDVVSGKLELQNMYGVYSVRAESDLSSADTYAQAILGGGTLTQSGPATRFATAQNTAYFAQIYTVTNNLYAAKYVNNVGVTYLANVAITPSFPETYKIQANGTTIKAYQAGVERVSVTDTAIDGSLGYRSGVGSYRGGSAKPTYDTFEAGDLAAGGVPSLLLQRKCTGMVMRTKSVLAKM